MAVAVIDCPHCSAQKSSFTVVAGTLHPTDRTRYAAFGTCSSCHGPAAFDLKTDIGQNPFQYSGNILGPKSPYYLVGAYPAPPVIDIPTDLPATVQSAFEQAERAHQAGIWDAAAGMYRKAMELGLKDHSPGIDAWKIEKRIDKMHAAGRITADIKDWAHELRLDGNDAMHETAADKETVEQMRAFCRAIFTYLYTLPGQVKAARERRTASEPQGN